MTIQYYDHYTQKLTKPYAYKVKRFIEYKCLEKITDNQWVCKPIPNYNTRTYTISRDFTWQNWKCNCQGFNKKNFCSHIAALLELLHNPQGQKELF